MNAQDRELLELAAKAAGIPLEFKTLLWTSGEKYPCYADVNSVSECNGDVVIRWNPLEHDGDALRLAVKLHLSADFFEDAILVGYTPNANDCEQVSEPTSDDPYAAARRCITRAAAEIGRNI